MKNLMKSILIVIALGFSSSSLFAVNGVAQDTVTLDTVKKDTVVYMAADEVTYTKIEVAEVPQVIKTAVAGKYAAYVTDEAYKGSDNSYKLVLKKEETKLTVYYNEKGEFQKEETAVKQQGI